MATQDKSLKGEIHDRPDAQNKTPDNPGQSRATAGAIPISPTVSRLSGLGLEIPASPSVQPGNAFARARTGDADGSKLPRKSGGKQDLD